MTSLVEVRHCQTFGGVSIGPNVSPPRHADMLLVSIFQLFYKDPDLKHVGMTREGGTATLPPRLRSVCFCSAVYVYCKPLSNCGFLKAEDCEQQSSFCILARTDLIRSLE